MDTDNIKSNNNTLSIIILSARAYKWYNLIKRKMEKKRKINKDTEIIDNSSQIHIYNIGLIVCLFITNSPKVTRFVRPLHIMNNITPPSPSAFYVAHRREGVGKLQCPARRAPLLPSGHNGARPPPRVSHKRRKSRGARHSCEHACLPAPWHPRGFRARFCFCR